jgi:hypothetical protein
MLTRVRATVADLLDLTQYETYSCFQTGSRSDTLRCDRDATGSLRFAWRKDTLPLTPELQAKLVAQGQLATAEGWFHLTDVQSGDPIKLHHRSIAWNSYRRRWVMITSESMGSSMLGEVWYAEADTPIGPWVYARKVVTHDRYSFYNPKQHPMFAEDDGRRLYFEGTYTHTFSGNPDRTPRYDYNQIMYRLDLDDSRLVLPVPVYRSRDVGNRERHRTATGPAEEREPQAIAFYACDRPSPVTVAVCPRPAAEGSGELVVVDGDRSAAETPPLPAFHALPADVREPPPATVPLYAWTHEDSGQTVYRVDNARGPPGFRRAELPLCRVWRNPRTR